MSPEQTFSQCLSFKVISRFDAFVFGVEIKNCIFPEYAQKMRKADEKFKFTKYVVQEMTFFFDFSKKICMKLTSV